MCGILFCASRQAVDSTSLGALCARLEKRGPDSQAFTHAKITAASEEIFLTFYSTVLSLRGSDITVQPLLDTKSASQFCWNGEAWSIGDRTISGNDAEAVFELLLAAASDHVHGRPSDDESVISSLNSLRGPFAFVFYDAIHARIYFGRDCLGRRSLLIKADQKGMYLSSVGDGTPGWKEVPADGIFVIHFNSDVVVPMRENAAISEALTEARICAQVRHFPYALRGRYDVFNHAIPSSQVPSLSVNSEPVSHLEQLLRRSLQIRTESIPYRVLSQASRPAVEHHADDGDADGEQQRNYLNDPLICSALATVNGPRLATLFSGGLDCTVLARLLHDILPPNEEVDLLNVAFHNPRVHGELTANSSVVFDACPDRITARASAAELNSVCPGRIWRLVEINVPYNEMLQHRDQVVSLMSPHDTEMDLSIALALYFAARGIGVIRDNTSQQLIRYETPARVLFSGLGADELFGGYQRHATAYTRQGFSGLLDELELDINRLGQRNLGRDDRVISHWSREARYPFLDEDLVKWAVTAPVWEKCGFGSTYDTLGDQVPLELEIEPGKKVLRLLALKLGMENVAREKKRAIQFGARTAKMLVGKSKGTHRITLDA